MICVGESTVKLVAVTPPNETSVVPVKPVPVMTTVVPPAAGPAVGAKPVIVGGGRKVNVPNETPVPLAFVTLRLTAPVPAGDTAVICVAEFTTKLAAAVPPKSTAVAPVNPVPVMTTVVPPACGPDVGLKLEMFGAGT